MKTTDAYRKSGIRSLGEDITEILITMNDEEKNLAYAMLKGMTVGKQITQALADSNTQKTA